MSFITIAAFYKFAEMTNPLALQASLKTFCKEHQIFGTIILAAEGINGTIAGSDENVKAILAFLCSYPHFSNLESKTSVSDFIPFRKLKIVIKKEIVTLGIPHIKPHQKCGTYVTPEQWNDLISEEEVLVVDTRNAFEIELGSFKGAKNPNTKKFRDFPSYVKNNLIPNKQQKIALFCTGGIRCEKASAYLLEQGFENVYQLQGGILKYLEKMNPKDSLWEGKCFVFDDRITIEKTSITKA